MSGLFRRLHDRQTPPGLELVILRKMPVICLAATLIPFGLSILVRLLPATDPVVDVAKRISTVDIFVVASIVTAWTALLTVSIACFIVFVMKGPAYVADAYPLDEAPRPAIDRNPSG